MRLVQGTVVVLFVSLCVVAARAELPPLSPAQLKADADLIVVGRVAALYSFNQEGTPEERQRGPWVDTRYVAEVLVKQVDKGAGPRAGEVTYVRLWRAKQRPDRWVGPSGNAIPKVGDEVRVFARRAKDGGVDVLVPNGVEVLRAR